MYLHEKVTSLQVVVVVVVVVFSFIKQLSDATDSEMGFTIKQFTEETRIH